ncbi:MAG TPA: hypothetical protein VFS43_34845 [Polyangiaceae bacterium]|nr:hypothetical protein [Polyangiaceae bacterium]
MSKARWVVAGLMVASMAGIMGSVEGEAAAGPAKCKPRVVVKNDKGAAIKVTKFRYTVAGSGELLSEDLNNKVVKARGDEDWNSETLNSAVKGVVVTSIAVDYQDDEGRGFGKTKTTTPVSTSGACGDDRTYTVTVR